MNHVALIGRLTGEPEIRETTTGKKIARYTLAVDRRVARAEQTADFISCQAWEKRADFVEKYLHKGSKIAVEGRIQTGSYTKQDGTKVYTFDVVVEEQEFAESKAAAQPAPQPQPEPTPAGTDWMQIPDNLDDEGLPFN